MNRRLKHAVIAGYGSGPGAAVAAVFARENFALALIARDAGKLAHAAPGYAERAIDGACPTGFQPH
jgi:short-subunit dehydrogenase